MQRRLMMACVIAVALGALFGSSASAATTATSKLTAVSGSGTGNLAVATTAEDHGTLAAQIDATVQGTSPNITFSVQRALDLTPNGTCDSLGAYEEQGTLTTSNGGAGAVHIERHTFAPSGLTFDVKFQLVGSDGSVLQSDCMTITVK
ncbi:MAG TPA: hypothetical protein VF972_00635 [Actinomycetota bacterium]